MKRTAILWIIALLGIARAGELHQAARVCNPAEMQFLLSQRVDVDERDATGMTPLHVAIDARKAECVRLLVRAGADRQARDNRGRSVADAVQQIVEARERMGILAAMTAHPGLQQKELVELGKPAPWSLEYAVKHRQANVTRMLLGLGVDPNVVGSEGNLPLADAALQGDVESVRALLEHGAKVNTVSRSGMQAIHDAALGDSAAVIRELVARGADLGARTRDEKQTPLHLAATMGKRNAVETLLALGADRTAKDVKGHTPLDAAKRAGLDEIVTLLQAM